MSTENEKLDNARRIIREKLGFIRHFIIYVVVLAMLAIINNNTWAGYQWWLWPALGWGIGLSVHFLTAFLFTGVNLEKRLMQRELKRLKDEE